MPGALKQPTCTPHRMQVAFMQHQGCEEYRRTLTWVNMSNPDFCWHFNFDEAEFEEWEAEWEAH